MSVTDELIAYEIDGRTFYENAGATDRYGLEAATQWQINNQWQWRSALTLAHYEFDEFVSVSDEGIVGNKMPGLPQAQWVNQLNWHSNNWRIELEGTYSGSVYAENSNTTKVDSYWLVNGRMGYQLSEGIALTWACVICLTKRILLMFGLMPIPIGRWKIEVILNLHRDATIT